MEFLGQEAEQSRQAVHALDKEITALAEGQNDLLDLVGNINQHTSGHMDGGSS